MATKVFDLYAEISLDNSSYMEGLKDSESAGKSFESTVKGNTSKVQTGFNSLSNAVSACKTALASIGVGFAIDKVVKGLSEAYNEATKLDEKLRGASTLYGSVAVDQTKLAENLKSISVQTGESLEVLGQTVYDAMSAGVQPTEDMADVLKVVSASSKLAKAGFTDTNTAMRASLSVINAYGMGIENVSKVSDILLNTQNLGVTTVGELSNALSKVTPVASAFGVSIENVTSALALMTKQGTNTEVASTGLSAILSELGKSGTTASDNLQKASQSAGLTETSFKDLLSSGKSLGDILDIMADYAEQNNLSLVDMFSSIEAGKSALQITNAGAEEFNKTLDSMETASGLVSDSFEKMITPSERLDSAIASLKVTIGEKFKPAIDSAKTALADIITKMLGQETQAEDLDTALSTLNKTLEDYALAQDEAKKKTDALNLSLEMTTKLNATVALKDLTDSWKQYEAENEKVNQTISETEAGLEGLYRKAEKWALDYTLIPEEDLNEIYDYEERMNTLLGLLQDFAEKKQQAYSEATNGEGGESYLHKNVRELIEDVQEYNINLITLKETQSQYENSLNSTTMAVAKFVKDGLLSLEEIRIYANPLYDDVVAILEGTSEKFEETEESVVSFATTATKNMEWYGKAMDEFYGKLYGINTEFSKASESIVNDTEMTKVEIYNALKDLSEQYELTTNDIEIISKAKAEASREIWKNFGEGFKNDMQKSFYSVTSSFQTLGETLANGGDAWDSFASIALNALSEILKNLGNQLTALAISKGVMGDWVGAGLAGAGAVFAYTSAGFVDSKAQSLLNKIGVDTSSSGGSGSSGGTSSTKTETEEERKDKQISSLEEEIAMLESLVANKEEGAEIPEQYQQDAKIRELQDRIRDLEKRLNDTKEVTVVQNISTVPMTPYELEQQAYIMAERLQWS